MGVGGGWFNFSSVPAIFSSYSLDRILAKYLPEKLIDPDIRVFMWFDTGTLQKIISSF